MFTARCQTFWRPGIAVMLVFSLLLASRGFAWASPHAAKPEALPTLRYSGMVGETGWFASLDPAQATDTISLNVISLVFASLVRRNPVTEVIQPDLATWKVSKNRLDYTFTIRQNARFSNGDRVTVQDAVYSIRRYLAHSTGTPGALAQIGIIQGATDYNAGTTTKLPGVKVLNKRQFLIKTTLVNVNFIRYLATWAGTVLDQRVMQGKNATANNNYMTNNCRGDIGAGPFKIQCRSGSGLNSFFPSGTTPSMTLVPNPYYYGAKAHIKISMQAVKDLQTGYLKYQAGELDTTGIPTSDISSQKGKTGFYSYRTLLVWYLSPAVNIAPFNNVHCRLALAYALNESQIDKDVMHGAWTPVHDMMPKPILGSYAGKDNPTFNPAKARQELAQCPGGIKGQHLLYQSTAADNDLVYAGAIPAMFQAVGIDIKGQGVPFNTWLKDVTSPQKDTNTPLAQSGLTNADSGRWCNLRLTGFNLNSSGFSNRTYDSYCNKAARTANVKKRAALYEKAQHVALSQGVFIPVGQARAYGLAKPYVHGLVGDGEYAILTAKNGNWADVSISKH